MISIPYVLILFSIVSNVCGAPVIVGTTFTQIGGAPPTDVKASFQITDLNNQAFLNLADFPNLGNPAQPLWLTISGFEDDFPIPIGTGDDLLGIFTVTLTENDVTALAGGGYTSKVFMNTFPGGVAAGGGIDDNDYFLQLENVQVHSVQVVPIPAAVWLFGSGLIALIGMGKKSSKSPTLLA